MNIDSDILISRVVDGEASDADWAELSRLAGEQPGLWRVLAEAQHEQADLIEQVAGAIAVAETVEAPVRQHMVRSLTHRTRVAAAWGGWIAAGLALAWTGTHRAPIDNAPQAGILNVGTPSEALGTYLDRGRQAGQVIGELPQKILVQSSPASDGNGYEIMYIRQILERAVVSDMYRFDQDEIGRVVPVPVQWKQGDEETF